MMPKLLATLTLLYTKEHLHVVVNGLPLKVHYPILKWLEPASNLHGNLFKYFVVVANPTLVRLPKKLAGLTNLTEHCSQGEKGERPRQRCLLEFPSMFGAIAR